MSDRAMAVVFTYLPDTGQCFATPFDDERHEDPLSFAHLFRESEEERGDFPGAVWAVTGNERATEIRADRLMKQWLGDDYTPSLTSIDSPGDR